MVGVEHPLEGGGGQGAPWGRGGDVLEDEGAVGVEHPLEGRGGQGGTLGRSKVTCKEGIEFELNGIYLNHLSLCSW